MVNHYIPETTVNITLYTTTVKYHPISPLLNMKTYVQTIEETSFFFLFTFVTSLVRLPLEHSQLFVFL